MQAEQDKIFEILILDNASNEAIDSQQIKISSKLHFFRSETNLGVAKGRNFLASKAQGDLLWFIDDDASLITKEATPKITAYFRKAALGVVSFKVINSFSGEEETRCIPDRKKTPTHQDCLASYFVGCSFVMRKKAFFEAGGFWEAFGYSCEELDLSYRLIEFNYQILRSSILEVQHEFFPEKSRNRNWIYFNTRNRPWLAIRNLPVFPLLSQTILWWLYGGLVAMKNLEIILYLKALFDSILGIPTAFSGRKVISKESFKKVASLGGRVWY